MAIPPDKRRTIHFLALAQVVLALLFIVPCRLYAGAGPGITTQPQSQNVLTGSNAFFTVVASGQTPLLYQWSFDETNLTNSAHIGGATTATLTVSNVSVADGGNYQVVVSNSHGSIASSNAMLTVLAPAAITSQPTNQSTYFGGSASFSVSAAGTVPLNYQWYFNGAPLSDNGQITGSTTAVLNISAAQSNNIGSYQVIVTNDYGSITSLVATLNITNATHYVNIAGSNPSPPYLNWTTAATNIQDAVDVAFAGDQVMVTNGTYTFGNRITSATTNCVVVTNAISISSVSGPAQTIIDGGGTNRCIYLTNGCWLSGFTLTNGYTPESGGGIFCASTNVIVTNCVVAGCSANQGGGVYQGTLIGSVLSNNSSGGGGGAVSSVLYNCTVSGNSGPGETGGGLVNCVANQCILTNNSSGYSVGGGAAQSTLNSCLLVNNGGCGAGNSTLNNCTLVGNTAGIWGGGARWSTLSNCTLIANSAVIGGGAEESTLYNCTLSNNVAQQFGGGAADGALSNCTLIANSAASYDGGGVYQMTLYNCTLSGNTAAQLGGGAYKSTLYSCTLSNNAAGQFGGGAGSSTLYNSFLFENVASIGSGGADSSVLVNSLIISNSAADYGGGVGDSTSSSSTGSPSILTNCVLAGNTVGQGEGGGAMQSSLYNCLLTGNSCLIYGGGAYVSTLINCTVAGNLATNGDGGVEVCSCTNCIVYYNNFVYSSSYSNPNYSSDDNLSWSCTTPLPANGVGNIASAPLFVNAGAGNFRLSPGSPCIDAGNILAVPVTVDLDGNPRTIGGTVDMGAYESQSAPVITIQPTNQIVPAGPSSVFFNAAAIGSGILAYQWQFNGVNIPGATSPTLVLSSAQFSDDGVYSVVVTNSFGVALSSNAMLTVLLPPMITLQPTNQAVPPGSSVTFTAAASGGAPLGYQWYFDGTALTDGGQFNGSATTSLTISNVQFTNTGNYMLVVTNPVGSATSSAAVLTVVGPPTLTAPLTNQVTMVFSNVTLAVSATGTPPLFYQWLQNGTPLTDGGNISGSSGPNLTLSNPQLAASGQYSVIVTNTYGALTNTAVLTVVPIYNWGNNVINPPASATNLIAIAVASFGFYNADFAVSANGSLLGWGNDFEFILDNLPTSTNFLSVTGADGNYIAITQTGTINTWGGTGAGPPANLTNVVAAEVENAGAAALLQNGTIVTWPGSPTPPANATNIIALSAGSWGLGGFLAVRQDGTVIGWGDNAWGETTPPASATNAVAVLCGDNQSLVLRADGTIVNFGTGASTPPASATNVTAIALGTDNAMVLRQDGTVIEWGALGAAPSFITNVVAIAANGVQNMVLVQDPNSSASPKILQQPLGAVTQTNQTLILEGQAFGSLPIQYQWYFNNAPLAGQTNRWLLLSPIQSSQGGSYQFVATNNFGSATSLTAVVWTPPLITTTPATTVAFGSNAVLNVTVAGTAPFGYQWSFNGTPLTDGGAISGSTTASLIISNFQPADLGNYTVTVTNLAGSATSAAATITVLNPQITSQPPNQLAYAGTTVSIAVTATGQQPLAYQWQYDGTNLPGATNNPLILSNVLVSQSGLYSVIVSNNYGITVSSNATFTVIALGIAGQPQNQSVLGGATARFSVSVIGSQPLYYQWLFNGTSLPGATNNPLVLSNVLVSQSGAYSVVVTNAYGTTVSANATLTVAPLAITTQPTNRITWLNGPTTFRVNVSGQPPFGFDWQNNGADVPGTWTNVLTLTNVQMSQFGTYDVIVSNAYGSVISSNVNLLFSQVAVWGGFQGESNLTPGLTNVIAIAAGSEENIDCLALRGNGTAIHWPSTNIFYGATNLLSIAGGGLQGPPFFVLERNGVMASWLVDDIVQPYSGFTNFVAIPAENIYLPLALTTNGTVISPSPTTHTPIIYATNAVAIAEGEGFGLALGSNGTVTAFGVNASGTNVAPGLSNIVAIAAAYSAGFAVKNDGTVAAWGQNVDNLVTFATNLNNVVAIAASEQHALALLTNGTVVAWGENNFGSGSVPPGLTNVIAIAAGPTFSMALIGNGPPVSRALLFNPNVGTNGFTLSLPSQSGRVYVLQYENSLEDTNWNSLPLVPGNGGMLMLTDPFPTNLQRFYRVQRW